MSSAARGGCPPRRKDPDADRRADDAAVEPQARVGWQEGSHWIIRVEGASIDDVVEARADDGADRHHDDGARHEPGVEAPAGGPLDWLTRIMTATAEDEADP